MSARAALGVAAGQYFSRFVLIGSAARRGIAEGLGAEALLAHGARRGGECSDRVGLLVPLHIGGPWALYGMGYGAMLVSKVPVFGGLLALGCMNFLSSRLLGDAPAASPRVRWFVEVEVGLGTTVVHPR